MALVELSRMEQRYRAVMEVIEQGRPVTEVAERYGVSRQSVHTWLARYRAEGIDGLEDRSQRPASCPHQTTDDVEAAVCDLRRKHPRWGPQRLRDELLRAGTVTLVPSRSSIYRILVRRGLLIPNGRRRHRSDYRRWERDEPMQLWQIDIMGGVWLQGDIEAKLVTGIDDASRHCILDRVVLHATSRAVCAAFADAMRRYGIPDEVLTDNGKQFTGRFNKPRPGETLFERICRENGITTRLTAPASPTTTGKIERFHQTLRQEFLNHQPPFPDLDAAQAAIDTYIDAYNTTRPHQALAGATPAERFTAVSSAAQAARTSITQALPLVTDDLTGDPRAAPRRLEPVELDKTVPPSGNLWIAGRQLWLGPKLAGETVRLWIDATTIHITHADTHLKTLPSRFNAADAPKLSRAGAKPAGPPPAGAAADPNTIGPDDPVEIDRTVNACGQISIGHTQIIVGSPLAGQRVTIRLDDAVAHVIADNRIIRTLPSPATGTARARLRGARQPAGPLPDQADYQTAQRTVSKQGAIQIAGQRMQVGYPHARKTVTVHIYPHHADIYDDGTSLRTITRTNTKEVTRLKAWTRKP